jgi:hypothetical protein
MWKRVCFAVQRIVVAVSAAMDVILKVHVRGEGLSTRVWTLDGVIKLQANMKQ